MKLCYALKRLERSDMRDEISWLDAKKLRYTLNRMRNVNELAKSEHAKTDLVTFELKRRNFRDVPYNRALVLKEILEKAIEDLRTGSEHFGTDTKEYQSLYYRYIVNQPKTRSELAKEFSLSLRSYDRTHERALNRLVINLEGHEKFARENMDNVSDANVVNNLDRRLPSFISRFDPETGEDIIKDRILPALDQHSRSWIVLLHGPGGMGKSSLALESAYQALQHQWFDGGVAWVDARTHVLSARRIGRHF
jgi:hypothetical protein